jgi:hypothetical protein
MTRFLVCLLTAGGAGERGVVEATFLRAADVSELRGGVSGW